LKKFLIDRDEIKKVISENFSNTTFTMYDVFYKMFSKWDKGLFGSLFNSMIAFTKEGFLNYKLISKESPSGYKQGRKKAIYSVNK